MNPKVSKFKVGNRVRITKYKNIFSKSLPENWFKKIFVIDSVLKTNPWAYKIKDLNGEKLIGSFYKNDVLLSNYKSVITQNQIATLEINPK